MNCSFLGTQLAAHSTRTPFAQVDSHLEEYEKVLDPDDPDGGWVDTHHFADSSVTSLSEKVADMALPAGASAGDHAQAMETGGDDDDDDDDDEEAEDMEAFAQSGMLDEADEESLAQRTKPQPEVRPADPGGAAGGPGVTGGEILATRTYDLNITYDKFYQTPRLWLFGYDEQRQPLTVEQMYEDLR